MDNCPFCELPEQRFVWQSDLVVAVLDNFPVSPGHTLLITRRHARTYFETTTEEQAAIWDGVQQVKRRLDHEYSPDGYNVGFNAEPAAGQTVMHVHVHVIPRFGGDMADPRGGVRGVIPGKRVYEVGGAAGDSVRDAEHQIGGTPGLAQRGLGNRASAGAGDHAAPDGDSPFSSFPQFVSGQDQHFVSVLRRALTLADEADIVAAFVQPGGLRQIDQYMSDALERGARVRLLTGDYMNTTSPDALRMILSLASRYPDRFTALFFDGGGRVSFHPKAYIFTKMQHGIAFVGSSNLSRTALTDGIEWNLRTVTSENTSEFESVRAGFDRLLALPEVKPLSRELVDQYSARVPIPLAPDPREPPPRPHSIQKEALEALRNTREEGERAGLVIMATGLGKTYLSAMDFQQIGGQRALFIAHREEILTQAQEAWQRVFPDKVLGLMTGGRREPDADILFASVQTLSRGEHLESFPRDHFDYIVVDEVHHAAASTYRRIIGYFEPQFLLGLTATPDRMDGASIRELCHDNEVYRAGLLRGINSGMLVPFDYYGVKDGIDFTNLPWRGRWPTDELTRAAATQERAEQALTEYRKHSPDGMRHALAFCCSVDHADFMAEYFRSQGIAAAAVHSGPSSAPRAESIQKVRNGELEILCAVDVFNEGLDVPDINVVLMLRPTESPIIFLQQLGRGLRRPTEDADSRLTIVDFIGNHRSFLAKPQALVALAGKDVPGAAALRVLREGELDLPDGCSVTIETEVLHMLAEVSRLSREDMLIHTYTNLRDGHGRRPMAAEVYAEGLHMRPVRERYGGWFEFVRTQGVPNAEENCDLTADELRVLDKHADWFRDLMTTNMVRSYKMVTLRAMLELEVLRDGVEIDTLVEQAWKILRDDTVLTAELGEVQKAENPLAALRDVWIKQPIAAWTHARATTQKWFEREGTQFRYRGQVDATDGSVFDEMTAELVDFRLAKHRDRILDRSTE